MKVKITEVTHNRKNMESTERTYVSEVFSVDDERSRILVADPEGALVWVKVGSKAVDDSVYVVRKAALTY